MLGSEALTKGLVVAMNDQSFNFVEGIDEVELFISDYLITNGYTMSEFIVESINGWRRHIRIFCNRNDESKASVYIELSLFE